MINFNAARGWGASPQDLAKSIVIESAELLEHFQWDASSKEINLDITKKNLQEIKYEVADVFWYITIFCHRTNIDLSEAVAAKLQHNEEKYPASKFAGKHNHDFYISQKMKYRAAKKKA